MAEGGFPPNDFPGRPFGYGGFYPPNFNPRESLNDGMEDAQPLDFSTKRRNSSDDQVKERFSTIDRVNKLDFNRRFSLGESSGTQRPRDMEDTLRFSPMSLTIPPEHNSSLSPPNSAAAGPSGSLSPGFTPAALARLQLQSNPLLLSTLQSALSRSTISEQARSYLTPRSSPSPNEFSPAGHLNDLDYLSGERGFQYGGLAGLRGANGAGTSGLGAGPSGLGAGPSGLGAGTSGLGAGTTGSSGLGAGTSGLGVGGLGTNNFGIGGGLGVGGLGRRASSPSVSPYEDSSHSFDSLGAFGSLSHGLGTENIVLLGNAYNTMAAMTSVNAASSPAEAAMTEESNSSYIKFREEMLKQVQAAKARRAPHRSTGLERSEEAPNENVSMSVCGDNAEESEAALADASISDQSNMDITMNDAGNGETSQNNAQEDISGGARRKTRANSDVVKDEAYWERRRKNNEAAKRSRDARRAKEDEIAIRAAYLEQENIKLKVELTSLKTETSKLRYLFYS